MNGKLVAGFLVVIGLSAGAAVWYLQVYGYYRTVEASSPVAAIMLTTVAGAAEPMVTAGFTGIDADSSPLRFRGCFTTPTSLATLTETYRVYDRPTPLIAPGWFSCFDAGRLTDDLAKGTAVAFLSEKNIGSRTDDQTGALRLSGVDRVVAVYPDGHAYAWQQLNDTAEN